MFLVVHKAVLHTAQHEAKLYKRKPLVEVAREKKKGGGGGEKEQDKRWNKKLSQIKKHCFLSHS